MNVIIANKYSEMLSNLHVDIIKNLKGVFSAEQIVENFQNFYFKKMILDITAIEDYQNIANIQKLSVGLDMDKVIFLLDDSQITNSPQYISQLISMSIYNFTKNIDAIAYLIDNPNSYKDVAQYHLLNQQIPIEKPKNVNKDKEESFINQSVNRVYMGTRTIVIKDLTDGAGATTLTYMMKKALSAEYKVLALEVDKKDFLYFNDADLRSVTSGELDSIVKNPNNDYDVILVDINDSPRISTINEAIYLVEPSTIKLNKMVRKDRLILEKMKSYKVILNKSLLSEKDVEEFEYESRCKVFDNIPPLDDKKDKIEEVDKLLVKMSFDRLKSSQVENKKGPKLFEIVKDN